MKSAPSGAAIARCRRRRRLGRSAAAAALISGPTDCCESAPSSRTGGGGLDSPWAQSTTADYSTVRPASTSSTVHSVCVPRTTADPRSDSRL